jgi:hypothetical protein
MQPMNQLEVGTISWTSAAATIASLVAAYFAYISSENSDNSYQEVRRLAHANTSIQSLE